MEKAEEHPADGHWWGGAAGHNSELLMCKTAIFVLIRLLYISNF